MLKLKDRTLDEVFFIEIIDSGGLMRKSPPKL